MSRMLFSAAFVIAAIIVMQAPAHSAQPPAAYKTLTAIPFSEADAPSSRVAVNTMITIPGADYWIGRDDGALSEAPSHRVWIAPFAMDQFEVTNAAFAEFLNALQLEIRGDFDRGGFSPSQASPNHAGLLREGGRGDGLYPLIALDDDEARIGYSNGAFRPTPGYELHPVAESTWAGALAYCRWRGGRLPSEVEWEAGARGGDQRLYPWGNEKPDASRVFVSHRTAETAAVGSKPNGASLFGVMDMSGSMAEWTSTLKRPYPYDATDGREQDNTSGERVTRGGDYRFDTADDKLTVTHRDGFSNAPERGHRHIGFRCAKDR